MTDVIHRRMPEPVARVGANPILERQAQLKAIFREVFPESISDGRLDLAWVRTNLAEVLPSTAAETQAAGPTDDVFYDSSGKERYRLTWAGKLDAERALRKPGEGTLVPVPAESVAYDTTQHLFIEGDNLEVLKLLHKPYLHSVKLVYIDPPYNTGNDFVYRDNYAEPLDEYLKLTGQQDANGDRLVDRNHTEKSGRIHSTWLSMMYPRLSLARQLLREDGLIFVSIDDREVHNLLMLMNEIYSEENHLGTLIWKRRQNVDSRAKTGLSIDHEYLIIYGKGENGVNGEREGNKVRGQEKDLTKYANPDNDPRGPWLSGDVTGLATKEQRPNLHYDLVNPATEVSYACPETGWRFGKPTMARLIAEGRIIWPPQPSGRPRVKRYQNELTSDFTGLSSVLNTVYSTQGTRELRELFDGKDVLDFPKPVEYMKLIVQQATSADEGDIVLDFFAGSSTTAQAVLEANRADEGNRRFIMVQLPEPTGNAQLPTVADIGKERIRRVIAHMQKEDEGKLDLSGGIAPPDRGFKVFRLRPSNYKSLHPVSTDDPDQYVGELQQTLEPLVTGWQPANVIWEVAIKEGLGLNSRVEQVSAVTTNSVFRVTDEERGQSFFICLDDKVDFSNLKPLNLGAEDLFICFDLAMDDSTVANLTLQCTLKTI